MEPITFKNSPLHHNDMVVRTNRQDVIEELFPEAAQAIANADRDHPLRLWAEAVIRYRNQVIRVVHHEIGEEHCGLTFTVNFGIVPRSWASRPCTPTSISSSTATVDVNQLLQPQTPCPWV